MPSAPPPPPQTTLPDLTVADVRRICSVLGIDVADLAGFLGARVESVDAWLSNGGPIEDAWRGALDELAREAKRERVLYLSSDIRRLRSFARVTQASLAKAIGVDRATVAQWEMGRRLPSGKRIEALRRFEKELVTAPPAPDVRACTRCGSRYPRTVHYFHRNDSAPDGLHSVCRGCRTGAGEAYWRRRYGTLL
jgi:DNA-binding XRE family transcriptional regulator